MDVDSEARYGVVPIEIREGVTVKIHPLPHDLTREEAEKISRVVMAYVPPHEG